MMRMKRVPGAKSSGTAPKMRPALTPEAKENQMISLAMDLVEQRLRDGTATSQETTHFLKLATRRARLEDEILEKQRELITAKTENIRSAARVEELYSEAINALRGYRGERHDDAEE